MCFHKTKCTHLQCVTYCSTMSHLEVEEKHRESCIITGYSYHNVRNMNKVMRERSIYVFSVGWQVASVPISARSRQNILIEMSLWVLRSTMSVAPSVVCLGLRRSCRHSFFLRICSMRLYTCTPDVCLTKHESAPVTMLQNNSNPLISVHTAHEQSGPKATPEARYLKSDTSSIH